MNKVSRIILHIDMNAFFASCEIAENESLRGKPIVVAHNDTFDRGLILSPSYEARKLGIKTTMKVYEAKKILPTIIVVNPTSGIYSKYSSLFYQYLLKITNMVEMASCDEAYVDISALNLGAKTIELASKIQKDLLSLYKLPCSIGIAPNKLLAKMASDMKKPLGITILRKRDIPTLMWPLPIEDMMYIGKKTSPRLREIGINTIGDLANYKDLSRLRSLFGDSFVEGTIPRCNGIDDSPVVIENEIATSASAAHTFMNDVIDTKLILETIKVLVNSVCYRIGKDHQLALNIGLQVKYGDYSSFNHSKPLLTPTNDEYTLYTEVKSIFDDFYETKGVRYIGVYSNRLEVKEDKPKQISIFDDLSSIEKEESIKKLIKEINQKFGKNSVKNGL